MISFPDYFFLLSHYQTASEKMHEKIKYTQQLISLGPSSGFSPGGSDHPLLLIAAT